MASKPHTSHVTVCLSKFMMSAAHAQTGMTFELYDITRIQTAPI